MSSRLFQTVVNQMKDVVKRVFGVVDSKDTVIACSDLSKIGAYRDVLSANLMGSQDVFIFDGYVYKMFGIHSSLEYAVFVEGVDETAIRCVKILAVALLNIKQYYDEKYDRNNFVKNIILDNILPGEIYIKAKELSFKTDVKRVAFLIRIVVGQEVPVFEVIRKLFPDRQKDFVFNINETDVILIKEVGNDILLGDLKKLATSIVDSLFSGLEAKVVVGIGSFVDNIKDLAGSFREAKVSLDISKAFDMNSPVTSYGHLGVYRLIYQLPVKLCEDFLGEVFRKEPIEALDEETFFTINKFFENNLNVSETSRRLFVHRNTLVYRLEKIKRITGLDLREFDDAIVFRIALMVRKYLASRLRDN